MKVLVAYSSMSGCTKKVAEALYNGLEGVEKTLADIKDKPDASGYDVVAVGYWVDKGGPNAQAAEFIKTLKGKRVFVFATLAYYIDSEHGFQSVWKGVKAAEEAGAEVIGHFGANGHLSDAIIERFKKMAAQGSDDHHAFTPEKGIRYAVMKDHPTAAECALASERFNERLELCRRLDAYKAQQAEGTCPFCGC